MTQLSRFDEMNDQELDDIKGQKDYGNMIVSIGEGTRNRFGVGYELIDNNGHKSVC